MKENDISNTTYLRFLEKGTPELDKKEGGGQDGMPVNVRTHGMLAKSGEFSGVSPKNCINEDGEGMKGLDM